MKFRLGLGLMTVLMAAACGGSEGDGTASETDTDGGASTGGATGELPEEVELDEFFELAEAAFCEWQVECRAYGVPARCRAVNHFEDRLNMQRLTGVGPDESIATAYYKEAVALGRIVYDESLASTCLEYVRKRGCEYPQYHEFTEDELAGQLACAGLFAGRMGKNGPCLSALECAETAICGFDPACVDMCCVGACRVLPTPLKVGEPCTGNRPCETDTFCAFDPNSGMPTVCTASPTAGQPCPQFDCAGGASCEFNGGDTPVCVALKAAGSSCNSDGQCQAGLVCTHDQNWDNGVCLRPADEGESCDRFSPDRVCRRVDNTCDATDRCAPLPDKGEFCPDYRCRGDLFCAGNQQRCTPVADAGEGCGYSNIDGSYIPCSGDNLCENEFDNGVCQTPSAASPCPVPEDPLAGG
jgi:hypothetical protein